MARKGSIQIANQHSFSSSLYFVSTNNGKLTVFLFLWNDWVQAPLFVVTQRLCWEANEFLVFALTIDDDNISFATHSHYYGCCSTESLTIDVQRQGQFRTQRKNLMPAKQLLNYSTVVMHKSMYVPFRIKLRKLFQACITKIMANTNARKREATWPPGSSC